MCPHPSCQEADKTPGCHPQGPQWEAGLSPTETHEGGNFFKRGEGRSLGSPKQRPVQMALFLPPLQTSTLRLREDGDPACLALPCPPASSPRNTQGLCAAAPNPLFPVWQCWGPAHSTGLGRVKTLESWVRSAPCGPTDKRFQSTGSGVGH